MFWKYLNVAYLLAHKFLTFLVIVLWKIHLNAIDAATAAQVRINTVCGGGGRCKFLGAHNKSK